MSPPVQAMNSNTECRAHARHAEDDLRVAMRAESGRHLRIDAGDVFVRGQH
jgi:hypothetical protein